MSCCVAQGPVVSGGQTSLQILLPSYLGRETEEVWKLWHLSPKPRSGYILQWRCHTSELARIPGSSQGEPTPGQLWATIFSEQVAHVRSRPVSVEFLLNIQHV